MVIEGETKKSDAGSMKPGSYMIVDGVASRVVDNQISRPGKHGHAKCRITAVGLLDGKKRVVVMPGHDKVDVPIIGKRTAQVLSIAGDTANVMDSETYETFDMPIPGELKGQVVEGAEVLYWVVLSERVMKQVKGTD
ncbi:translation initiation factor IF-5A [Candidatus Woesearchaeota archaeon]|nr:translation initiation factor IF-5A [Candidatus Woesearchaeota archaeon]